MHTTQLVLAAFCLVTVTVTATADVADVDRAKTASVQTTLDRLARMPTAEQQAWLKQLEVRAARAARLTLKPDEVVECEKDMHARLHQKTITWQVLGKVIEETDKREREAIDKLAKSYRLLVFQIFHKDLHVYGDRQRAWLELHQSWKDVGSPFWSQDRLIDWLEAALRSVTPNRIGPIPKKPKFEAVDKRPRVVEKTKDAKPQAAVESQATRKQQVVKSFLPAPETAVSAPGRSVAQVRLSRHKDDPAAVVPRRVEPALPVAARLADFQLSQRKAPSSSDSQPVVSQDVLRKIATSDQPGKSSSEAVVVKVDELSACISGCNMAFRALEMELDEKGDWTAARLEPLMDRLKILLLRRHDLNLFRDALSESQRASIDPVASEKGVVAQFSARIVAARQRASDRQDELAQLEKLSRRLGELTGK